MSNNIIRKIVFWSVLIIPYGLLIGGYFWHKAEINEIKNAKIIIVDKDNLTLSVFSYKGKKISEYPVAVGRNFGNKQIEGDCKTPEGVFPIVSIEDASDWEYDFEDDNRGPVKGAYGNWFMRLETPVNNSIGIHGTHNDSLIGQRASHGCIRMHNSHLNELKQNIQTGTIVAIIPSAYDMLINRDTSDVIQQMLNLQGGFK